jgi:hypothetical protein
MMSDTDRLVKTLKESLYFRALLDDNTRTRKVSDVAVNSKFYRA